MDLFDSSVFAVRWEMIGAIPALVSCLGLVVIPGVALYVRERRARRGLKEQWWRN